MADLNATAYRNGLWWDGLAFREQTRFAVGGMFQFAAPRGALRDVDLNGGYVVPPFGEAHNHNIQTLDDVRGLVARYLDHGIFFAKNPNNLPRDRPAVAPLEVAFANGGWTSSGGHPIEIAQRAIERGQWSHSDGEAGFYWTADTPTDVERKWPAYLAQQPDFVKVYLLYADQQRRGDRYDGWRGLALDTLRAIVERAHAAGLRVTAHIESRADFREALKAGVDELGHMPGFRMHADVDSHGAQEFELSAADVALALDRRAVVVTTLCGAENLEGVARAEQDALNVNNLRCLAEGRVPIAIGSDSYRQDAREEAIYLSSLRALANVDLLKMWTTTVASIFPGRRRDASFVVLAGDPLVDFSAVTRITRRVKAGRDLSLGADDLPVTK